MPDLDFALFDADNHYYEPRDCFTRYIEPGMRDRAVHVETDGRGRPTVLVGDRPFTFLVDGFPERVSKPGSLRELLRHLASGTLATSDAVDRAAAELDWALGRGARVVSLRPGPAYGRSPADPHFDPFWARVDEARAVVAFHIGESGYNEMLAPWWGEEPNPSSHRQSAFQWTISYGDRPIMDTFSALILHNLFGRFPNVRCLSVENGSLWVPYLLKVMNKMNGMGRNGPWLGGRLTEKPSEIFTRHVFVSPYHEEDVVSLVGTIGAGQVVFGS